MSAVEPLYSLFGCNKKLTHEEAHLLEAELFLRLYSELNETFRMDNKKYFELMRFDKEKENLMLESSFIRNIIKDVVATGEYSLEGIAHSTNIPEEVVVEMALGQNDNPSFHTSRKIMELHKSLRGDLYKSILNRILHSQT